MGNTLLRRRVTEIEGFMQDIAKKGWEGNGDYLYDGHKEGDPWLLVENSRI